jgi:hypothetical protein
MRDVILIARPGMGRILTVIVVAIAEDRQDQVSRQRC